MVAVVDYGVGNLFSLACSLRYLGVDSVITRKPAEIDGASHVILPGVGAFGDAAARLRESGLDAVVAAQAKAGKPLLGICLGMQLLYEESTEYGIHSGLGLVPGRIISLRGALSNGALKVPHMGWNQLEARRECALLRYMGADRCVYYVHSFYAPVSADTAASSLYGDVDVTGIVARGNVFGTQFHPEKSGGVGLGILRAFAEL